MVFLELLYIIHLRKPPRLQADCGTQIEHGKIKVTGGNWRTDEFVRMLNTFVKELPDTQIAMNRLDQPRVIVEWETLQEHLKVEEESRNLDRLVTNGFSRSRGLGGLNYILCSDISYIADQSR